jgi:hypothetical protein
MHRVWRTQWVYLFSLLHKLVAHLGLGQEVHSEGLELSSNNNNLNNSTLRQLHKLVSGLSGKALSNRNNSNNNNNQRSQRSLVQEGHSDRLASRSRHNHHSRAQQQLDLVVDLARAFLRFLRRAALEPSVPQILLRIPPRLLGILAVAIHRFRQVCLVPHRRLLNLPRQPHLLARLGHHWDQITPLSSNRRLPLYLEGLLLPLLSPVRRLRLAAPHLDNHRRPSVLRHLAHSVCQKPTHPLEREYITTFRSAIYSFSLIAFTQVNIVRSVAV